MQLLIRRGRLIDPARKVDALVDVLIAGGRIARIAPRIDPARVLHGQGKAGVRTIDAHGKIIAPGFIDMHTHLREPGEEGKESVASGCKAAAAGGFTAVACMPNTVPVNDNKLVTHYILSKALAEGCVRVYPIGAITRGSQGERLADIGELKTAGVVALSDDGEPVISAEVLRRAMEYATNFALPIISHCEDKSLSSGGVMHEGYWSTRLGLPGIPAAAEEVMVARDVILAEMTGCRLHIAHVSTAGAVEIIRAAKAKGIQVTAEATPHHFTLTDEAVASFSTNTKVNPPLRSEFHRGALREGLRDGTIDAIATDHAPHHQNAKDLEYITAANGMVGLETAVSLTLSELVHPGIITLDQAIAKLSTNPGRILGVEGGTLREGDRADLTILDLTRPVVVDPKKFFSKSTNTPFAGRRLQGGPVMTIVGGRVAWEAQQGDC